MRPKTTQYYIDTQEPKMKEIEAPYKDSTSTTKNRLLCNGCQETCKSRRSNRPDEPFDKELNMNISQDRTTKALCCVSIANVLTAENRAAFKETLNRLFTENNLPTLNLNNIPIPPMNNDAEEHTQIIADEQQN